MAAVAPQIPGQNREQPQGQRNWARGRIRGAGFKWSSLAHGSRERSLHTKQQHTHSRVCMQTQTDCLVYIDYAHADTHECFSVIFTRDKK